MIISAKIQIAKTMPKNPASIGIPPALNADTIQLKTIISKTIKETNQKSLANWFQRKIKKFIVYYI